MEMSDTLDVAGKVNRIPFPGLNLSLGREPARKPCEGFTTSREQTFMR